MTRLVPSLSTIRRLGRWFLAVGLAAALVAAVAGWLVVERARTNLPDPDDLSELRPDYGTRVQAPDGTYLGGERAVEPVPYDELPPRLVATFLAAEDEDFFEHGGYNPRSILRALYENVRAGETVQGASTITQQVAKHFLEPEKTWFRKLREFLLARRIEDEFTKPEILAAYLGGVYFGENAWGVTQASYTYFSKSPRELTIGQMATLAGLLPAPSDYNPVDNPELARRERNRVLIRLRDIGVLDNEEFRTEIDRPLEGPTRPARPLSPAPEATNTVLRNWEEIGDGRDWETSELEITTTHHPGYQTLLRRSIQKGVEDHDRRRGYRGPVGHTESPERFDRTLDEWTGDTGLIPARITAVDDSGLGLRIPGGEIRIAADDLDWAHGVEPDSGDSRSPGADWSEPFSVDDVVVVQNPGETPRIWQPPVHQGAGAVTDHHSGELLASVGSYDIDASSYHRAEQACRQPGSLFKTIVYTEAFSADVTPATLLSDVPTDVRAREGVWRPRNADRDFSGYITALDSLVFSRNIPTVNLFQHLGASAVVDRARRMGVDSTLDPEPSLALGSSCTRLVEMLDVYATLGRGGLAAGRSALATIRDISTGRIRDEGHFLSRAPSAVPRVVRAADRVRPADRVVDPAVRVLVTDALRQVLTRGTARELPDDWPVAAKTGTSDDYDAWLAAYDPDLTATVWVGSDHYETPFSSGEHAGTIAAPVFEDFYRGLAPEETEWPPASPEDHGVEEVAIDPATGLRARPGEPGVPYLFRTGTAPRKFAPTRATRQLEHFDSAVY